jgi:hypothetical protein
VSALLAEALKKLNLQPGQTYRTTVNGCEVELRVFAPTVAKTPPEESSEFADQVMHEPWVWFPDPPAVATVVAKPGPIDWPDPPVIPPEDEVG